MKYVWLPSKSAMVDKVSEVPTTLCTVVAYLVSQGLFRSADDAIRRMAIRIVRERDANVPEIVLPYFENTRVDR